MPIAQNFYQLVYVDTRTNKVADAGAPVPKSQLFDLQEQQTLHELTARGDEYGMNDRLRAEIRVVPTSPAQQVWSGLCDRLQIARTPIITTSAPGPGANRG